MRANRSQDACRLFTAGVLKALAHPTRVAIVELLRANRAMPVGHIAEALGIRQANASQHLSVLRAQHVVSSTKEGNRAVYRLRHPLLGQVLDALEGHLRTRASELKDMAGGT
jgi:DNA-binding transcriptional ArsR family regulator